MAVKQIDILIVVSHMGSGGAQRVITRLISGWQASNLKVGLLISNANTESVYDLPSDVVLIEQKRHIATKSFFKISGAYTILSSLFNLRSAIKEYKPKIVLSFICPTNIKTIIASLFIKDIKVIISERNNPDRQAFPVYIKKSRQFLYRFADVVTANSLGAIDSLKKYVPANKLIYIPNPVDLPDTEHSNEKAHNIVRFLYVGRLVPQKRVLELLESFIIFKRKFSNAELCFVGDGPLLNKMKHLAEKSELQGSISFPGHVSDVDNYYMASDILVLISKYEGMPNVLLEAMSFGVCCIVSNEVNESAKLIENQKNGLVIDASSIELVADVFYKLASDASLRNKISINSKESIHEYSIENVLHQWSIAFESN